MAPSDSEPAASASDSASGRLHIRRRRLVLWVGLSAALVLWVLFVPVSTISFRTVRITETTVRHFRDVVEMSIPEVWAYQLDTLPEVPMQGLMTAAFAGSMVVAFVAAVAGCWLLLAPGVERPRRGRPRLRA